MAVRRLFGKTHWGRAWVEALERIDYYTNRLPRGRRYAREGLVRHIEIVEGKVQAKVKGSRPSPYRVSMALRKFTKRQKQGIKAVVAGHPGLAAELSLGRLPEALLDLLAARGLSPLPSSWEEFDATCSCPDWANPCKHLAAVYYVLANEIDKDPFVLFALRGLDPPELLAAAGLSPAPTVRSDPFRPLEEMAPSGWEAPFSVELDLTLEEDTSRALFALLPENPLFYPTGDFKRLLLQAYQNVSRAANELLPVEERPRLAGVDFWLLYPAKSLDVPTEARFFVSPYGRFPGYRTGRTVRKELPWPAEGALELKPRTGEIIPVEVGVDFFLFLALDPTLERSSPSARFLSLAAATAQALARAGAYRPEVVTGPKGEFRLRYRPLVTSERVTEVVRRLAEAAPPGLVFRAKDRTVLTEVEAAVEVLSLFLTRLVARFSGIPAADPVTAAFFRGEVYRPSRFQEQRTAKAVADWLARLSMQSSEVRPVLRIELPAGEDTCGELELRVEVEDRRDPLASPVPLAKLFGRSRSVFARPVEEVRSEVARQLALAAEYLPELLEALNGRGKTPLTLNVERLAEFLERGRDVLNLLGVRVVVPKELGRLAQARVILRATVKESGVSFLNLDRVLSFSWEVAVGDTTLTREEFLRLARSASGLVRIRDGYLLLRPEDVGRLLQKLERPVPRPSSLEVLRACLTGELGEVPFRPPQALEELAAELSRSHRPALPKELAAELRLYQERGYQWLYTNLTRGFGCCLADDMGLGKTVQAIALILKWKEEGRLSSSALVVCPTTLLGNWEKECRRFAPSLAVAVYHGAVRELPASQVDVLITTYGILRRDLERFCSREWSLLVVDEAQNLKNPESEQTRAVKSLPARARLALSGTPVENRLSELWSLFDFLNPGYLGSLAEFGRRFIVPIEKYRDRDRIEKLRQATAPFILRRLKTDRAVIKDLPDKVINNEYCHLTPEQAALYQEVVDGTLRQIEASAGITRRGLIFKLLTALRQICNHPVHFTRKGEPAKELSGKAEKAVELINGVVRSGEKALVFTQFREMGELLVRLLSRELEEEILFFHGGLSPAARTALVERFQESADCPVMVVSLKAGGTGLNLTAATNVLHYDLWWNPAVEDQATDRAYRIGQTRTVMVYRLITLGTFEEKIEEMLSAKRELAELAVSAGERWLTELSDRELREIFALSRV